MDRDKGQELRVSAKTLDQALLEAAAMLKTSPEQVDYRIVSQSAGFFFLGKKIEIAVTKRGAATRQEARYRDELYGQGPEAPELTAAEIAALKTELVEFCAGIAGFFADDGFAKVSAKVVGDRLILDIDDSQFEAQLLKNTKLAESLEHVLRKKPRHLKRELPFRLFVDARGVRQQREADLAVMAKDLSEKVHENKRPIVLNYKSSYDRKIIHMALDKDARVYTKSIGSGVNRKLMILPIKDGHGEAQEIDL